MRQQELHLVVENLATLQIDILRMGWAERNRKQFHTGLLGGSACLVVITTLTGGDDIHPAVLSALAKRVDMVSREKEMWKLLTTVQAQVLIAPEQGLVT